MATVTLLENTAFYSHLYRLIDGARRSVHIANFSFNVDENLDTKQRVRDLIRLLARRQRAGVDVKVLFGNSYKSDPASAFEGLDSSNELSFTLLHACGVPAAFFKHPRFGSSHCKYALIDGEVTVLGSHNLSPRALAVGNDDSVAIADATVATKVGRQFRADWARAKRPPASEIVAFNAALLQRTAQAPAAARSASVNGAMAVEVLFDKSYFDRVLQAIRAATATIDLSMFYFSASRSNSSVTARLLNALVAAKGRGVAVRVILDRDKPGEIYASQRANRRRYGELRAAGIKVKWDSPEVASHTKLMIVDRDLVFIGSHNWTEGSHSRYQELSVAIVAPALASAYTRMFERRFRRRR